MINLDTDTLMAAVLFLVLFVNLLALVVALVIFTRIYREVKAEGVQPAAMSEDSRDLFVSGGLVLRPVVPQAEMGVRRV